MHGRYELSRGQAQVLGSALGAPCRLQILYSLTQTRSATTSEIAASIHSSKQTTRRHLEALVNLRIVHEEAGIARGHVGRPATRFSLAPEIGAALGPLLLLLLDALATNSY